MPEGRAGRAVEAHRQHAESVDGAEHSFTVTRMMAAAHQTTPGETPQHPPNTNCCTSHDSR